MSLERRLHLANDAFASLLLSDTLETLHRTLQPSQHHFTESGSDELDTKMINGSRYALLFANHSKSDQRWDALDSIGTNIGGSVDGDSGTAGEVEVRLGSGPVGRIQCSQAYR